MKNVLLWHDFGTSFPDNYTLYETRSNVDLLALGKGDAGNNRNKITKPIDERLLADVVHKIKNGLGGIAGFATLLERDLAPNDSNKRLVKRIQDGVNHVNDVVVDLMTLVRATEPKFEKVPVLSLIKDEWNYMLDITGQSADKISITHDEPVRELYLFADPNLLQKMVNHIFRFIHTLGSRIETVHLSNKRRGKLSVTFQFTNGKSKNKLPENILQFMHDGEPIQARLSLAIIWKIARLHGGKVTTVAYSDNHKILTLQLAKGN